MSKKFSEISVSRHLLFVFLSVAIGAACSAALAAPDESIEGTWLVTSVELGGQAVPGLKGAKLTLANGQKSFELPSGVVEDGTYELDSRQSPAHMDATTDGKPGTQMGIYQIEGDTLTLCLSQGGQIRPHEFATANDADLILIELRRAESPVNDPAATVLKPSGARKFRMGFTGFVYDITPDAVAESRKFVRENGDSLAHHIEGVPWAEAHSDQPFSNPYSSRNSARGSSSGVGARDSIRTIVSDCSISPGWKPNGPRPLL